MFRFGRGIVVRGCFQIVVDVVEAFTTNSAEDGLEDARNENNG
jgi:hypothetical protein